MVFALFQVGRPEVDTLILLDREVRLLCVFLLFEIFCNAYFITMALLVSTFTFLFQVDMVTPMCSQLTYEGLIDEVMSQNLDTAVLTRSSLSRFCSHCNWDSLLYEEVTLTSFIILLLVI